MKDCRRGELQAMMNELKKGGIHSEKPRPGNPFVAWAAGNCRGFRGFISTAGKFFKNDHPDQLDHQGHKKQFSATEKNHKNPKYPVLLSDRAPLLLPTTTSYLHFEQENNAVVQITV